MTARMPCRPETLDLLSAVKDGAGYTYDELVNALVVLMQEPNETHEELGNRIRGEMLRLKREHNAD